MAKPSRCKMFTALIFVNYFNSCTKSPGMNKFTQFLFFNGLKEVRKSKCNFDAILKSLEEIF